MFRYSCFTIIIVCLVFASNYGLSKNSANERSVFRHALYVEGVDEFEVHKTTSVPGSQCHHWACADGTCVGWFPPTCHECPDPKVGFTCLYVGGTYTCVLFGSGGSCGHLHRGNCWLEYPITWHCIADEQLGACAAVYQDCTLQ
jgi:hypothetical protein